jgi:predicted DNA-binding WGR domain protein
MFKKHKLRAQSIDSNINRVYEIAIIKGLFNSVCVIIGWGRFGSKGQSKVVPFETWDEAEVFVQKKIKKRLGSEKRIGVAYEWFD